MVRTIAAILVLALAAPALAQDREQTLADIRQELSVLWVEVQKLKRELVTTGGPSTQIAGTSALDRINAIEAELSRTIARTEELQNRIDRVVADGTNRIGDLEFRLVELEGGDVSKLGETTTLGGGAMPPASGTALPAPAAAPVTGGPTAGSGGAELAMGEQADFDKARDAFEKGDLEAAVLGFQTFTETYPGGPLSGEAHFWRGEALNGLGNTSAAARAYLDSFSGDPNGTMAPDALLQLGLSLNRLGQVQESCVMLGEVTVRFPTSAASVEAQAARGSMACG